MKIAFSPQLSHRATNEFGVALWFCWIATLFERIRLAVPVQGHPQVLLVLP
jgi:hypothetical protein